MTVGAAIPYLSPVRFLPSIITLLNTRLIRVWRVARPGAPCLAIFETWGLL
jgi:hypothetical protein